MYFVKNRVNVICHLSQKIPQFLDREKKKVNADNLAAGIYLFAMGLAKKVLLADVFGDNPCI